MSRVILLSRSAELAAVVRLLGGLAGLQVEVSGTADGEDVTSGFRWEPDDLLLLDLRSCAAADLSGVVALPAEPPARSRVVVLHPQEAVAQALSAEWTGAAEGPVRWLPQDLPVLSTLDLLRLHSARCRAREESPDLSALTRREFEVTELAARGRSNAEIAQQLELSAETVKTYVARSREKLGLDTRDELREAYRRAEG